jgi:nitroreductase
MADGAGSLSVEEIIRGRRTVRRFTQDPVSSAVLRELLALASHAPNIANRQMWRFIVVANPDLRRMLERLVDRRLAEVTGWPELADNPTRVRAWRASALHFAEAPVTIVVVNTGYQTPFDAALVDHGMRAAEVEGLFGHPELQSIGAVLGYLTLLAAARGYGTCWMTTPLLARRDLEAALELKPLEAIVALMAMGVPAENPLPKARRPVDEIIEWR